jgi:hypothetical protein
MLALRRIETLMRELIHKVGHMSQGMDDLKAAITEAAALMVTAAEDIVAVAKGDSDADVEALAQSLKASSATFKTALDAAFPAPAPAPEQPAA